MINWTLSKINLKKTPTSLGVYPRRKKTLYGSVCGSFVRNTPILEAAQLSLSLCGVQQTQDVHTGGIGGAGSIQQAPGDSPENYAQWEEPVLKGYTTCESILSILSWNDRSTEIEAGCEVLDWTAARSTEMEARCKVLDWTAACLDRVSVASWLRGWAASLQETTVGQTG